jgi:IS30 family transposase
LTIAGGSNERMNAIIRRYLPKGTSFKITPQIYLEDIAFNINSMPRKLFNFKSTYEIEQDY